jgi:hypothetical protein
MATLPMHRVLIISLMPFLAACGGVRVHPGAREVGTTPSVGLESVAAVGDPIYAEFDMVMRTGVRLLDPVQWQKMGVSVEIPPGTFLQAGTGHGRTEYCALEPMVRRVIGASTVPCFSDPENRGVLTEIHLIDTARHWEISPAHYEAARLATDMGGYRLELLYQGLDGPTLRLTYREYRNDFARPFFTRT